VIAPKSFVFLVVALAHHGPGVVPRRLSFSAGRRPALPLICKAGKSRIFGLASPGAGILASYRQLGDPTEPGRWMLNRSQAGRGSVGGVRSNIVGSFQNSNLWGRRKEAEGEEGGWPWRSLTSPATDGRFGFVSTASRPDNCICDVLRVSRGSRVDYSYQEQVTIDNIEAGMGVRLKSGDCPRSATFLVPDRLIAHPSRSHQAFPK
jgi:hypothetical protein